ncbi:MAG: hypothetical protein K2K31_01775 [Clostridia bacterium]|nr:hypothetical protein [Clostridia bacterium]
MRRKWILAIVLALVVIAVVLTVVLVFVLKEKDTKKLAEQLNTSTTTGYLSSTSEEYKEITKYLDEISANSGNLSQYQVALIKNYLVIYKTSLNVSDFVNRQMPFTQWTEFYSKNGEDVVNNLKNAQKKAEEIKKDIASDRQVANGNSIVLANLWNDRKNDVTTMIDHTETAMKTLVDIYTSCVTTKTFNNDLTELIFKLYKVQISKVDQDLKSNRDEKGASTVEAERLNSFVDAYLTYSVIKEDVVNYYNQYGDNYSNVGNKVVVEDLNKKWDKSVYYKDYNQIMEGKLFELKEKDFNLSIASGYGENSVTSKTYKVYNSITLSSINRSGYKLVGWKVVSDSVGTWVKDTVYTVEDGKEKIIEAGNIGDVRLEAQWEETPSI